MSESQIWLGAEATNRCSSRFGATGSPWRLSVVTGLNRREAVALIPCCRTTRTPRPRLTRPPSAPAAPRPPPHAPPPRPPPPPRRREGAARRGGAIAAAVLGIQTLHVLEQLPV